MKVFQQLTSSYLLFIVAKLGRYSEDAVGMLSITTRRAQKPVVSGAIVPFVKAI